MGKANVSRDEIREQLKEDEVLEAGKHVMQWAKANARLLISLAVLIVIAVIVWKTVEYRNEKALVNSGIAYSQAQMSYDQAVYGQKSPQERITSLQETLAKIQELRAQYPGTSAGRMAFYLEGMTHMAMADKSASADSLDKAIATFRSYADSAKSADEKSRGLLGLAATYVNRAWIKENPADYKTAAETYDQILRLVPRDSYLAAEAKLGLARLHVAEGNAEKAIPLYREVIALRPKPERSPAPETDQMDMQRRYMRQTVEMLLDRHSYAELAQQELDSILPSSASELGVEIPGAGAQATPAKDAAK